MTFEELNRTWEHLGEADPLWAILTSPDKRLGRWDSGEFFETGRFEVDRILNWVGPELARHGLKLGRERALDFGCGVGRLTQVLAQKFASCDGVDIAASMIDQAHEMNRLGERCRFHVNKETDLRLFDDSTFDFVYSAHVLQHMEPRFQKSYVGEFTRLLTEGGVAVFQTVTERKVGATAALPDDAFAVRLAAAPIPETVSPGQHLAVVITMTNLGPHTLPAAGKDGWFQVTVGNHWLDAGGRRIVNDDGRAVLPYDVEPRQSVEVVLDVRIPDSTGNLKLEIDCVQEAVAWFGDRGSSTTVLDVCAASPKRSWLRRRGTTDAGPAAAGYDVEKATMEMHGVRDDLMRAWVGEAGGRVIDSTSWETLFGSDSRDWDRQIYIVGRSG